MMRKYLLFFFTIIALTGITQTSHSLLMDGDAAYKKQDFTLAEESYHKSHEKERSYKAAYNLANSLLQQERFEEADGYYLESIGRMTDDVTKSKAYHNLGISLFKQQKFDESIDAFKNGIKHNPNDPDIKDNLILAKLAKKQQEQQQQEQQQNDQQQGDQNQEQQDQNQEQQNQEQQEQQENQDTEEQQQQQEEQQEKQDSTSMSQADPSDENTEEQDSTKMMMMQLSKEEAERLLQAAELEERKVQEKLKRVKSNKKKPTKDW